MLPQGAIRHYFGGLVGCPHYREDSLVVQEFQYCKRFGHAGLTFRNIQLVIYRDYGNVKVK
jgi:hypothetical protein